MCAGVCRCVNALNSEHSCQLLPWGQSQTKDSLQSGKYKHQGVCICMFEKHAHSHFLSLSAFLQGHHLIQSMTYTVVAGLTCRSYHVNPGEVGAKDKNKSVAPKNQQGEESVKFDLVTLSFAFTSLRVCELKEKAFRSFDTVAALPADQTCQELTTSEWTVTHSNLYCAVSSNL